MSVSIHVDGPGYLVAVYDCRANDPSIGKCGEVSGSAGLASAMSGREPKTWQSALVAEIWSCYLGGNKANERFVRAIGAWETSWNWSEWSETSELASCIAASSPRVLPEAPVRVQLSVTIED